jgi:ketosteroid isomerase-like protein
MQNRNGRPIVAEAKGVENLRRGYKAFADSDVATLTELIPEDAVWHVPGRSVLAGDKKGREEILGMFGKLAELTGGTFKADLVHMLGDDNYVVALQRTTASVNGKEIDSFDVVVQRLENDLPAETWQMSSNPYEADELLTG